MTFSELYKWTVKELRQGILQVDATFKAKMINPWQSTQGSANVRNEFAFIFKFAKFSVPIAKKNLNSSFI